MSKIKTEPPNFQLCSPQTRAAAEYEGTNLSIQCLVIFCGIKKHKKTKNMLRTIATILKKIQKMKKIFK